MYTTEQVDRFWIGELKETAVRVQCPCGFVGYVQEKCMRAKCNACKQWLYIRIVNGVAAKITIGTFHGNPEGPEIGRERLLRILLTVAGAVCWYCGKDLTGQEKHIDHIRARSKNGGDDLFNLALTCKFCNLAKGDRDIDEFYEWIDSLMAGGKIFNPKLPHPLSNLQRLLGGNPNAESGRD